MIKIVNVDVVDYNEHGKPIESLTITDGDFIVQFETDENSIWEEFNQNQLEDLFEEVGALACNGVKGYRFI